jgi:uncharacterized membrane protein
MAESELLLTFAEVAVAFAGFASLVSILGQRSSVDHALVLGARMRAMLLSSLLVTGFALLPPVISWYGATPGSTWLISTLALLLVVVLYLAWFVRALRTLSRHVGTNRFQRYVIMPVLSVIFGGLLSVLVVNTVFRSPALYVTALTLLLSQGGFAFALIVFSFLPGAPVRGIRESTSDAGEEP